MKNQFSFNGVGQGLFYSGRIWDGTFNFVYDCGTKSSDKTFIKNAIDKLPPELDFIAISHLHDDHINGLPEILERVRVEKIFLPYFDTKTYRDVFIASLIVGDISPNTPAFNLILKLYDVTIEFNNDDLSRSCFVHIESTKKVFLQEDLTPYDICEKWCFRFYNRKIDDSCYDELNAKLQELLNGKSIEQYIYESNGDFKELRDTYKKLHNNYNMTSLILMHWNPLNPTEKTLLTGDIRFDKDLEIRVCNDIEENDRIIFQVPHHGALGEWEALPERIKLQANYFVFSFGEKNSYHHPYGKVLVYLNEKLKAKDKIKFVYENVSFLY